MAALGATSMLVGVDDYSTYPPEVTKLAKVGSFISPNLEAVIALRPTLVILDDIHSTVGGALRDVHIATAACRMHDLPDVKRALVEVGQQIDRAAQAARAVEQIDVALDAAAAKRPANRTKVLAIIDREAGGLGNLVAAGPGSWIDELLAVVGAENTLAASGVRYPKISREEVLRGQPDVILDLSFPARTSITEWNELATPAATNHRVIALAEPFLVAPSPRVKEALELLAKVTAP